MASKRKRGQVAKLTIVDPDKCATALREFVSAIEVTGGVLRSPSGLHAPVADPTWTDLGAAYVQACASLGCAPVITESDEEEDEDEPR